MECLDGDDLKGHIEKGSFIPFEHKLGYVIEVCEALDYAHQNDIVHRDIKPGNMFFTLEGGLKIVDFGLARLTTSDVTRSGVIVGSPYYMSPEQVKGLPDIDGRSDLFSVGVVLYELVAGRRPFEGDTPTSVCFQIVSEIHEPIIEVLPGCSSELGKIIDRALAKDRDHRYQNGVEIAADLRQVTAQIPSIHESLKRSIDTLGKRLKYLADRGTIDPADAQVPSLPGWTRRLRRPSVRARRVDATHPEGSPDGCFREQLKHLHGNAGIGYRDRSCQARATAIASSGDSTKPVEMVGVGCGGGRRHSRDTGPQLECVAALL